MPKKPGAIDKTSFESLESLFESIQLQTKKFEQEMQRVQRDLASNQEKAQKRLISNYLKDMKDGEEVSLYHIEALKKKFLEENAQKDKDARIKAIHEIYKKEIENNMKSVQKKKKDELLAQKEINQAILKMYEEREAKGETLTKTEQEDKERAKRDVQAAKQMERNTNAMSLAFKAMTNMTNMLSSAVTTYAKYQSSVNARLQGSNLSSGVNFTSVVERLRYGQNTFGILENRLNSAIGINPYVKNETVMTNLSELVKAGIAANVEQRAFLQTIKEDIAETFDVANASLLRIVRLQQQDSTAARLGMEAALTKYLNQMVESTEYLSTTFDSVEEALIEASSQMTMKASTEFEYIVQKWLGALSGTGLSESTATQIAQAIGYLGSGNISQLNNSSMMNLLTIAAGRGGMNIGDLLNQGLTASTTNQLLKSIAEYMVEIGSSGTNVVKSQLAQTFGLNISDITAAQQLSKNFESISKSMLSYTGMYNELNKQMFALPGRLSIGEMLQNNFDNMMFSLSKGIAENPALMAMWQIADMVQNVTGGINIPAAFAVGSGVDLNTTVENLVKLGVVGKSSFNWIGDMLSGLTSTLAPMSMLHKLRILSGNTAISRGGGLSSAISGLTTSQSSFVGSSGSDMYSQTLQSSYETAQSDETIQPQNEETKELPSHVASIDDNLVKVLSVLNDIKTRLDGEFEVSNSVINGSSGSTLYF